MSLNQTSARVRPWAGRDEAFAEAMRRAEDRAEGHANGVPLKATRPGDSVGRTSDGWIVCQDGSSFDGNDLPPERLAHLPILS